MLPGAPPGPATPRVIIEDSGSDNRVVFRDAGSSSPAFAASLRIYGDYNTVLIGKGAEGIKGLEITIFGNHHSVTLGDQLVVANKLEIHIGVPYDEPRSHGCSVTIGEGTWIDSATLEVSDHESRVAIGPSCLLAANVRFELCDCHAILSATTGELLNRGRVIEIADHVWLGHDVTVLKNSVIASGCVVGCHAVVAGRFTEPQVAIAGNSARVIKRGIQWQKQSVNWFLGHSAQAEGPQVGVKP